MVIVPSKAGLKSIAAEAVLAGTAQQHWPVVRSFMRHEVAKDQPNRIADLASGAAEREYMRKMAREQVQRDEAPGNRMSTGLDEEQRLEIEMFNYMKATRQ